MRRYPLPLLLLTAILLTVSLLEGCKTFKSNPGTTMTITNRSSVPIKEVEVSYPGGFVGAPSIAPGQSYTQWVPTKACNLQVKFVDASNMQQSPKQVDLGKTCPKATTIEIAADFSVTAHATQ